MSTNGRQQTLVAAGAIALASAFGLGAFACASHEAPTDAGADSDAGDSATVPTSDAPTLPDAPPPSPQTVTFAYTPSWPGVTSVSVFGGFGRPSDWRPDAPFVTLTNDGHGTFRGSAQLPPGSYPYLFRIEGDASAAPGKASKLPRYALDPSNSAVEPCPPGSPTFSMFDANPCSKLVVPRASAPAALHHARGVVLVDGKPADGWLVVLERNETGSHHFFVDRATTKNGGAFDLAAAPGIYRLMVLHPTFLAATDEMRDPVALGALRDTTSTNFPLITDVAVPSPEVGFHDYDSFAPRGDAGALPTHFTFANDGGVPARLAIYATVADAGEIGNPWYLAPQPSTSGADFDGGFNTHQANDLGVRPGDRYFWGTQQAARGDGGIKWSGQTMVFPITWR